jgi:hypothetical protein
VSKFACNPIQNVWSPDFWNANCICSCHRFINFSS